MPEGIGAIPGEFPEDARRWTELLEEQVESYDKKIYDQAIEIQGYRRRVSHLLGVLISLGKMTKGGRCFCQPPPEPEIGGEHSDECRMARDALLMGIKE